MKIMASDPITSWQIDGETMETVTDFILRVFKITADSDCSHEIKRHLFLGRKAMANLDSILKSRDITLPTKVFLVKLQFFSSHVWMWEFDYKESWVLKNWCFWTVVLEKTLESPLDCKNIQPVHPEGNQSWIFIGKTDAEAETLILWPPDAKNWLIGKDPDSGEDWRQEKGMTEDEMVGRQHWLDGHEFEQAPRVGDGQGGLACCSPWGCKELDTTEWLNCIELSKGVVTVGSLLLATSVEAVAGVFGSCFYFISETGWERSVLSDWSPAYDHLITALFTGQTGVVVLLGLWAAWLRSHRDPL